MVFETLDIVLLLVTGGVIIAGIALGIGLKSRHRRKLLLQPFPPEYLDILKNNVALYALLPAELQAELQGRIAVFLDEKEFEGCGGLQIDARIKVTIAAFAGMLLLNKDLDYYPALRSILVYPDAYVASDSRSRLGTVTVVDRESVRLGESWTYGNLVFSWQQIENEAGNIHCHHNVILHEFAHQLDQSDGIADGTPLLPDKGIYPEWRQVMQREYDRLCREAEHAVRDVIDWYGATNPAEFFAVTTESFFCNPLALQGAHRKLYELFVEFYRLDPASWRKPGVSGNKNRTGHQSERS
ncbi:MAG: zinc-dependent peptidase [Victivallaceae bacterium]|nr:zinc-dependent peptidase [Victivallaceae bacterium]